MITASDLLLARQHVGESQQVFARRMGISQSAYARWELGSARLATPSMQKLVRLSIGRIITKAKAAQQQQTEATNGQAVGADERDRA